MPRLRYFVCKLLFFIFRFTWTKKLDEIKTLVVSKRDLHAIKHPTAKGKLAEFKDDTSKNLKFDLLNSLAEHLKGDRRITRNYLKGDKSSYYRGKLKFSSKNT